MSIIKFPYKLESLHPQYLWNQLEFDVRALTQNAIKINVYEALDSNQIIFQYAADRAMNNVAFGMVDMPVPLEEYSFNNSVSRYIYCNKTTGALYANTTKPVWSTIYQGHYDSELNRCIALIDPDLPSGSRCILMDSFNSMFEYEQRIPDSGGELIEITQLGTSVPFTLDPKYKYRIEIMGGKGGNGGDSVDEIPGIGSNLSIRGGTGALGEIKIIKIKPFHHVSLTAFRGRNGANGEKSKMDIYNYRSISIGNMKWYYCFVVGSGGGSSGEDTYVMIKNLIIKAIGGAGGGGAAAWPVVNTDWNFQGGTDFFSAGYINYYNIYSANGSGGGGAGYGSAGNGSYLRTDSINYTHGRAGTLANGGREGNRGTVTVNTSLPIPQSGLPGQDIGVGSRRNGGSSLGLTYDTVTIPPSKGGDSALSTSQGYIRIYRWAA